MKVKASFLHRTAAIGWLISIIPTVIWWRNSLLWVAFMSVWANLASHWSAYEAALAKEHTEKGDDEE